MPTTTSFPAWLSNWRYLMTNYLETFYTTRYLVLYYAAMSMKPRIKDRMLVSQQLRCKEVR